MKQYMKININRCFQIVCAGMASAFVLLIFLVVHTGYSFSESADLLEREAYFERIVSLAPSLTEILFELSLEERVVGVTKYCRYPAKALTKTVIGGYLNPNYEVLLSLKPDLLVVLNEHENICPHLKSLGLNFVMFDNRSINGIMQSIQRMGQLCQTTEKAGFVLENLKKRMDHVQSRTKGRVSPRVLISVGRKMGSGSIKDSYIATQKTYFSDMVVLAGGINAFTGNLTGFPKVSGEGILNINPDVIIDMVSGLPDSQIGVVMDEWQVLKSVKAVKDQRIYVLTQPYADIPGPRFIDILENIAKMLHPEVNF